MSEPSTVDSVKSTAAKPDLDWSQVKETVLMLRLAAAQIDFSLHEGNSSVDALTDSFTGMAESMQAIQQSAQQIFRKYSIEDQLSQDMMQHCDAVSSKVQQAIIAFQFYDKLVQRLDHVVDSLSRLGELVGDASRLYSPNEWRGLQERIRSRYTMGEERELFDALMNGEDIQTVLDRMREWAQNTSADDDIELF